MRYECSLQLFGLIDQDGVHELVDTLKIAGFGLPADALGWFSAGKTTYAAIHSGSPALDPRVRDCLFRLGLYAIWECQDQEQNVTFHVVSPEHGRLIRCAYTADEERYCPLGADADDASVEGLFERLPGTYYVHVSKPPARLLVARTRHDVMSASSSDELMVGAFESYRNPGRALT